jgi:pimeloyl-ACP methyl ester carboxylesterase
MTGLELFWLGRKLSLLGFKVKRFHYLSLQWDLTRSADQLYREIEQSRGVKLHLVGHSLGGLVIARMLERHPQVSHMVRVAFLATPFKGSKVASVLHCYWLGRMILGPAAREGIIAQRPIPPAGRQCLVISGTLPFGVGILFGVPFPNDGTVAVAETEIPAACHLEVRASHMGMLYSDKVATAIGAFFSSEQVDLTVHKK